MNSWLIEDIEDALFVGVIGGLFEDIREDLQGPSEKRYKECYIELLKQSTLLQISPEPSEASLIGGRVQTLWSDLIEIVESETKYGLDGLLSTLIYCIQQLKENSASPKPSLPMWLPNPWGKVLPSFKKSKKRHYWIYSDGPNYGKTTGFAKPLEKEYRCVIQAGDFSSWNVSGSVECIILDDYNTPALKWSTLNQLCDNTYSFRVLYSRPKRLDNFLVIILSNFSIKDLYPNMNIFLYERFNEIKL